MLGSIMLIIHGRWLGTLPQKYTVGKVLDIYKPAKGGIMAKYEYQFYGNKYEQHIPLGSYRNKIKERERYLVEVPNGYSNQGLILFDKPVPDSVKAPLNGWDKPPKFW